MRSPTHLMNKPAILTRVTFTEAPAADGTPQATETTETVLLAEFPGENGEDGNVQSETRLVYLPPNLGITGADRLTFNDDNWVLVGAAMELRHPKTDDPVFAKATVKRVV